jgi:hypothetical protein
MVLTAAIAVGGLAGGCRGAAPDASAPGSSGPASVASPASDPLAGVDTALDAVEQDVDAAASDG